MSITLDAFVSALNIVSFFEGVFLAATDAEAASSHELEYGSFARACLLRFSQDPKV